MLSQLTITEKRFTELDLDEIVWIHLNARPHHPCKTHHILSTMGLAITESHHARGNAYSNVLLPLLGMFTVLDQMGTLYFDPNKTPPANTNLSTLRGALYFFCGIDPDSDEGKALWALRNAIVHDGSVVSRGRFKRGAYQGPFHRYAFDNEAAKLIDIPNPPWDGQFGTAPYTRVSIAKFIELVNEGVCKAQRLHETGNLGIHIQDPNELIDRFLLTMPHKAPS